MNDDTYTDIDRYMDRVTQRLGVHYKCRGADEFLALAAWAADQATADLHPPARRAVADLATRLYEALDELLNPEEY